MKQKIKLGGLKIKVSWKTSRLIKSITNFFSFKWLKGKGYTLREYNPPTPDEIAKIKLYRIFKQEHCEFLPSGKTYDYNGAQPSCYVYYKGCNKLGCERCLIGELMFGEDKYDFFIRKAIIIQEDIHEYRIVQGEEVLASYDKEWVNKQGRYQ